MDLCGQIPAKRAWSPRKNFKESLARVRVTELPCHQCATFRITQMTPRNGVADT